jgi:hypothetical protein
MNDLDRLDDDQPEGKAVRALVKRALGTSSSVDAPDLLPGIQRRLRRRSRGRFFATIGWSTAQTRMSYVLVGLLTLLVVALAYLVLGPALSSR